MALAFTTTSDDQAGSLGAGTYVGHVLVGHARCSLSGAGIDVTVIKLDGTYNTAVRAVANRQSFALRNLTLDVDNLAAVTATIEANAVIPEFTLENVKILDHRRGTYAVFNNAALTASGLVIVGQGAGIYHAASATSTVVRGAVVRGGQYGFVNVGAAGIDLADMHVRLDYWAVPTYEAVVATAYDSSGADVASHVAADRASGDIMRHLRPVTTFLPEAGLRSSLVRLWDRAETADGRWSQVLDFARDGTAILDDWRAAGRWRPVAAPVDQATVYRVVLGRLVYAPPTRLDFRSGSSPPSPRWRHVDGTVAPTPQTFPGTRLDIIRHGNVANRDTDTGAFHITETATGALMTRCQAFGSGSDSISMRGAGSTATGCTASMGYDEGYTVDGTVGRMTLINCQSLGTGRTGFHLAGGPSDLFDCWAAGSGMINDGSGDFGATTTAACAGSTMQVRGINNLDGLFGGIIASESPGGFVEAPRDRSIFGLRVTAARTRGAGWRRRRDD